MNKPRAAALTKSPADTMRAVASGVPAKRKSASTPTMRAVCDEIGLATPSGAILGMVVTMGEPERVGGRMRLRRGLRRKEPIDWLVGYMANPKCEARYKRLNERELAGLHRYVQAKAQSEQGDIAAANMTPTPHGEGKRDHGARSREIAQGRLEVARAIRGVYSDLVLDVDAVLFAAPELETAKLTKRANKIGFGKGARLIAAAFQTEAYR